jgi:hypothetical protein
VDAATGCMIHCNQIFLSAGLAATKSSAGRSLSFITRLT